MPLGFKNVLFSQFFVIWDLLLPYLTERQALNVFRSGKDVYQLFAQNARIENGGLWQWKLLPPLDFAELLFCKLEISGSSPHGNDGMQIEWAPNEQEECRNFKNQLKKKEGICKKVADTVIQNYPSNECYTYFLTNECIQRKILLPTHQECGGRVFRVNFEVHFRIIFFVQDQKKIKRREISSMSSSKRRATVTRFVMSYKTNVVWGK